MTRLPNRRLLALALAAGFGAPALAQAAEPFPVSDIRVDGLQRDQRVELDGLGHVALHQ